MQCCPVAAKIVTTDLFCCGSDFLFVCVLQNRAQAVTELLQELNSDVSGHFAEEVRVVEALV